MQFGGLRRHHEQRRALAEASNIANGKRLEGPGTEERLRRIQSRFRRLQASSAESPLSLPLACVVMFAAVLSEGLFLDWFL